MEQESKTTGTLKAITPPRLPSLKDPGASLFHLVWLTLIWALLWGDFSFKTLFGGLIMTLIVMYALPMHRATNEKITVRPIALARLIVVFLLDVVKASAQITYAILTRKKLEAAIIRVHTRAESDIFLAVTSGFTAMVPGSIVIDAHRMTGMMYVHVFDVSGEDGLQKAHDTVIEQEERILRALASDQVLIEAGYVPSGSMRAGRLEKSAKDSYVPLNSKEASR